MEKREIRFDGWCVNFESGEITKGGETHRLQDQPLQILDELTQRPGQVVTREQLIARLWPKGVVEFDTGLNTAMRKLRIALGDDADTPRYIETIPRKGYRFIGVLETTAVPTVPELPSLPSQYVPTSFETGDVIGRRASDRQAPLSAWPGDSAASSWRPCSRWSRGTCRASCSRLIRRKRNCPPSWYCRWST